MQIAYALHNASANRRTSVATERSDAELIQSIAAGDKLAVQVLYARHNVRVYRFILRFTRDESLAEDILSEVFLDVWRQAASFKGKSQVSTWLYAIARHKAIAAGRRRKFDALDDVEEAALEDPQDNPEKVLDKKDRAALIQKCLNLLSPIHREIVDLVYYQSKTIYEAAEIIGIPLNTVKTRMFWARSRLEEMLRQAGVEHAHA